MRTDLSDVEIKWAARQRGILVNCLSEYCFADTQKYRGILVIHYSDMEDELLQKVIGALEEIAEVMVFLASDSARGVNGNIMFVDGGTDALLNSEKVY